MIDVDSLEFSYRDVPVLKGVSFQASPGDFVALLGPNGVGKSTLFRCMLGLLHPAAGVVRLDGTPVQEFTPGARAKKIAYIPQFTTPVYNYTVLESVLMGVAGQLGPIANPAHKHVKAAEAALDRLGISHLKNRGFGRISGGERQLALLARALVQNAGILIMDEPTASLDYGNQHRVLGIIKALCNDGYTVLLSTHNPDVAFQYANRAVMLLDGRAIADGPPRDVLTEQLISTAYQMFVELQTLSTSTGPVTVCLPKIIGD